MAAHPRSSRAPWLQPDRDVPIRLLSLHEGVQVVGSAQLSGYLLEEVVAHLLQSSGYRLLRAADDKDALVWRNNGLRVRGRGAEHQADALGDLAIQIPFSMPIRLFVEAKNTRAKVGLDVVRNAHGVVHDVNEFTRAAATRIRRVRQLRQVQYRYSIFSTSGFTRGAQSFALAHQISLIDLSGPAWGALALKLRRASLAVHRLLPAGNGGTLARRALRDALSRLEPSQWDDTNDPAVPIPDEVRDWARRLATSVLRTPSGADDILLGFVDAPFVLALRPQDSDAFREHVADRHQPISVHIGYDERGPAGGDWVIQDSRDPNAFRLTFPLPGVLEELLLAAPPEEQVRMAVSAKNLLMSTITVFLDGRPVALTYERVPTARAQAVAENAKQMTDLRRELRPLPGTRPTVLEDEEMTVVEPSEPWEPPAIEELLRRLESGGYIQGQLIREAARLGGSIPRSRVYEIADFDSERTLRGLARPSNRIRAQMVDEGMLPPGAKYPFEAAYARGVQASRYEVPEEFVEWLCRSW